MDSLFQDIRFGARMLLRAPGLSIAVVVALALGIGANSAMFSVVDALILHPLRYQDPSSLVMVWDREVRGTIHPAAEANYLDWRTRAKSFSDLAAWQGATFVLNGLDRPQQISGARVSANFFRTLGAKPMRGRTFLPDEDGFDSGRERAAVVVIGYQLWQQQMGGDPNVLGRTIRLNEAPYAIVGVMPPDFQFFGPRYQLWLFPALDRANRDFHSLQVVGRLRVPREQAQAEMTALARGLAEQYPKSNQGWTIQVDDFQEWLVNGRFRTRLLLLFGAVGVVLLIACTNVASLMLARSSARHREVAVRIALGATRVRLIRQLLTESVMLALAGGLAGLALAAALISIAPSLIPADTLPSTAPVNLSPMVILFTLAVSLGTGILSGLAPALSAARTGVLEVLQDSSRGSTAGRKRQTFRQAMVISEIALALVLLAGASLMIESLRKMSRIDLGFRSDHLLTLRIFLPSARYDAARALRFYRQALERVAALPGVESASISTNLPLNRLTMGVPFDLEDSPPRSLAERPDVGYVSVSPGYLHTLAIPLKAGREFVEGDNETAPPVAMINEAFAARYFPHQNPMGKRLLVNRPVLGRTTFLDTVRVEIVGIAGDVKLNDLNAPPEPVLYVPQAQSEWSVVGWLAVRTRIDSGGLANPIRTAMLDLDREQPIDQVGSLEQTFYEQFAQPRFQSRLMVAFAGLALILAVVGIYGVNAYSVNERKREIGVRMALGATPGQVQGQILGQGMKLAGIGIAVGLAGALALSPVVKSVLVGVDSADPVILAGVAGLLAVVAGLACWVPALRAARTDPAIALRD